MWMIVGLGNPGDRYSGSRHNAGFAIVDALATDLGIDMHRSKKLGAVIGTGSSVTLVKPTTFMNASGESVQKVARYHHISPDRVVVVHDDLETPEGRVGVMMSGGGHRGHNGMRSVLAHMKNGVACIRVGIGRPSSRADVSEYVLRRDFEIDPGVVEQVRDILLKRDVIPTI